MKPAIIVWSLGLTLLAGTTAHAAPKPAKPAASKANVARTAAITEIQVTSYGQQGPHDQGYSATTYRLWPDRVNYFRGEGVETRNPRLPVSAAALSSGDFQGLARYIQLSPLINMLTPEGARERPAGGPAGYELQIVVVRGGKRAGVYVPSDVDEEINANTNPAKVAGWVVYQIVQSIVPADGWGEIVGGRVDTGLQATFDSSVSYIPENERPVFAVLDAVGKEVTTLRADYGDDSDEAEMRGESISSNFLPPGNYRLLKKAAPAGRGGLTASKPKVYDWIAVPSTITLKAGEFADVKIADRLGGLAKLLAAAEGDKLEEVRSLLDTGLPVNARTGEEGAPTILMAAVRRGNLALASLLLNKGAEIDARDKSGRTALMMAENLASARLLLDKGAEIDARDEGGRTALTGALGNTELAGFLIEKGARVNEKDNDGNSALMNAAAGANVALTRWLIEKGAGVNAQNGNGRTALMMALEYKDVPEGPPVDESLELEVARALIEKGAQVNMQDGDGLSALMIAAEYGKTEAVRLLMEKGAAVNAKAKDGKTALLMASQFTWADAPLVRLLIEKGAGVNAQDIVGKTALMYLAPQFPRLELGRALVEKGAQVNLQDKDGNTALMLAAQHGNAEFVRLLLARKADVTLKSKSGKTALALATDHATRKLLRAAGAK